MANWKHSSGLRVTRTPAVPANDRHNYKSKRRRTPNSIPPSTPKSERRLRRTPAGAPRLSPRGISAHEATACERLPTTLQLSTNSKVPTAGEPQEAPLGIPPVLSRSSRCVHGTTHHALPMALSNQPVTVFSAQHAESAVPAAPSNTTSPLPLL